MNPSDKRLLISVVLSVLAGLAFTRDLTILGVITMFWAVFAFMAALGAAIQEKEKKS